jgi:hypothetical protein
MSGLLRVAHAPPWPAEHAPLACFAWVRGLRPPPPFAAPLPFALTPAATPRMKGASPGRPRASTATERQRWGQEGA